MPYIEASMVGAARIMLGKSMGVVKLPRGAAFIIGVDSIYRAARGFLINVRGGWLVTTPYLLFLSS